MAERRNPTESQLRRDAASRESKLTATFVEVADNLVTEYDVVEMLHTLAVRCVDIFGVDEAGIMLKDETGTLRAVASSSEGAHAMDLLQLQSQTGPCWEAVETGAPVFVSDLESEADRWPDYVEEGLALGLRSIDALPLRLRNRSVGALNLFRTEKGGSSAEDLSAMQALSDVATISLLQARATEEAESTTAHLQVALDSRVLIEQAKGIVSNGLDLDMGRAFGLLREYSRNHREKLTEVCQSVVDGKLHPSDLQ